LDAFWFGAVSADNPGYPDDHELR